MSQKVTHKLNLFHLALRRLKIKSLDLYSYFKSRINRTSHRRRSVHSGSLGGYISFLRNWRKAAYTSTVLLTLTTLAILFPISFRSATPVEGATKGATVSTLAFTSNTSSASASLSVSDTSGSFATSSSNASFSIETNNATGYTLNIKTGNDTTTLSDGNNHTIPSIETSKTASNFTNNAWGLLPSKYEGSNNTTNYYPASSNGFTMDTTSSSNTGNANTYTVGLGLKADYTIPAGTYTNTTIVAEYVANPITYAIYYYSNTDDTVTGMPATNPQVPASSFPGTTATTTNLASAPTRTGYTFLGWCLGTSSSSNITVGTNGAADTCGDSSTNQFTAGQSFGINATGSSPDLYYFYAMWQANTYTVTISNSNTTSSVASLTIPYGSSKTVTVTPNSGYYLSSVSCPSGVSCTGYSTGESYTGAQTVTITNNTATTSSGTLSFVAEEPKVYMQEMTLADCSADGMTVYDKRDESSYTVKKLADGYCWMTQNLALDLTALTQAQLYGTDTNAGKLTNASNTTLGYLKNGGGTASDQWAMAAVKKTWTSSYSYSEPWIAVDSTTSGKCNSASYCTGGSALTWSSADTTSGGVAQGKVGVYYNYCAASAGSYCYGNGTSAGTSSGNASEDICPYGWHLPAGDTAQGSFYYLYNTGYSANDNNFQTALSTPFSGYFYSGKAYDQGDLGYFWSSTRNSNYSMYRLYVYPSSVAPQSNDIRGNGSSVRCVKDKDYMQSMTSDSLASLMPNTGDTTTLVDARDDQEYTIAKIADNKYWMTKNLNLAGGTAISCTTSDCENYTIPTTQGWQSGGKLPASSTSGFNTDNYAYVYNSGSTTCGNNSSCYSYYSWDAATLGSGRSIATNNANAPYSICPKGWKLPTTYDGSGTAAEATDFRALMIALGGSNSVQTYNLSTTPTGATMYGKLSASPYSFLLAGYYYRGWLYSGGTQGDYWSATSVSDTTYARYLHFNNEYVNSANNIIRYCGLSVRCVFDG